MPNHEMTPEELTDAQKALQDNIGANLKEPFQEFTEKMMGQTVDPAAVLQKHLALEEKVKELEGSANGRLLELERQVKDLQEGLRNVLNLLQSDLQEDDSELYDDEDDLDDGMTPEENAALDELEAEDEQDSGDKEGDSV